ncbi:MAG: ferritin [Planctomycetota bacterium]
MLSKSIEGAINDQINHEFSSAYVYLSMSAFFDRMSYPGFAHWARIQSQEEVVHAMKLFDYLNDRGGRVALKAITEPQSDFSSVVAVFEHALEQEKFVTQLIHRLYEFATTEKDYATQAALVWFINEQVEEEKASTDIVEQLRRIKDDKTALLILDRELAQRPAAQTPGAGEG